MYIAVELQSYLIPCYLVWHDKNICETKNVTSTLQKATYSYCSTFLITVNLNTVFICSQLAEADVS